MPLLLTDGMSPAVRPIAQHLPRRDAAGAQQLGASRERPAPPRTDLRCYPDVDRQQRPTCSTSSSSSSSRCDCAPSTSASTSADGGSAHSGGGGVGRRERRPLNDRNAASLTARITRTHSLVELQELVRRYGTQFNHIHTAAAIVKLAKLASGSAAHEPSSSTPTQQQEGGAPLGSTASPEPGPAGLERSGAGRSRLDASPEDAGAGPPLPPEPGGHGGNGSGSGWQAARRSTAAVAPAAPCAAALLADLAPAFLAQQHHYPTARQFANVVWALGVLRARDHPQLLAAAEARLLADGGSKLAGALPQELSNLALGLAKVGYREVPLWGAIIAAAKRRLREFKPQELHNLAWAVAAASQDRSMISAAVQAALPQLRGFNPSGLANMLWACATAQCHCQELFDGAAELLLAAPPAALNSQDAANTAWAFAKMQHPHPRLAGHLARWAMEAGPAGVRRAATGELVSLLWAFASMPLPTGPGAGGGARGRELGSSGGGSGSGAGGGSGGGGGGGGSGGGGREPLQPARPPAAAATPDGGPSLLPHLLRLLVTEVAARADLTPQAASNALWACGRVQPCSLPAAPLALLLRAASARAGAMSDQELSNALWGAGKLRAWGHWVPAELAAPMLALACCPARLEALPPAQLTQLLSAAVQLRLVGSAPMDALATRVLRCLPGAGPQEVCTLAGAVADAVFVSSYCNPLLLNGLANAAVAGADLLDPQVRARRACVCRKGPSRSGMVGPGRGQGDQGW
ncbi:hypothetical protein TSOC_007381 [Tetrabaena socialis]|uniref:Tbc2 translation factor, chloroplastic n=1 Tax=Tetrabaena socialis TaxID=47790 RepID=A0A2J8A166_9CHLO|nr:hypothetical protein TSOC_007381 [Tetrabaena socialis]|eukprot:PNH06264.1 hypothetical protein TSOC_007381 [Tetrabaena socialis]